MIRNITPTKEALDILRLIRSENVGVRTFYNLIRLYGSASNALEHIEELSLKGGRSKPIKIYTSSMVDQELTKLQAMGAGILVFSEAEYPSLLRSISDAPPVISYIGDKSIFPRASCSIVGARNASLNGLNFAKILARDLARNSIVTVSGLARGIDTAVHQASLGSTIAVIAGGLDHIYPPENANLYRKISEAGAIIAELPIGSVPLAQHFPQRNRLISGLSMVTIVVEASLKSGSLITARMALEQGREVGAVPGFPMDPRCQGTNKLIKEGAHLIESSEDVLELAMSHRGGNNPQFYDKDASVNKDLRVVKHDITESDRQLVTDMLSATPVEMDSIQAHTGLPISMLYVIILELELAGKIMRHRGNKVSMVYSE